MLLTKNNFLLEILLSLSHNFIAQQEFYNNKNILKKVNYR